MNTNDLIHQTRDNRVFLRTPDSAFADLQGYPFEPHFVEIDGLRMHYLDEGSSNQKTIFLLHGQPSWSYLYRKMIPVLSGAGYRVIAPDLIGYGKSDKPVESSSHTYQAHVDWMSAFVEKLGITNAAAFMQDWGGMIGLRVLANHPKWLDRLVIANTALAEVRGPTKWIMPRMLKLLTILSGKPTADKFAEKKNYGNWAAYFRHSKQLEIGKLMQILTTRDMNQSELDAYDAPFPTPNFYAAPRKMPEIVATDLDKVNVDWEKLKKWDKPVLTLFSDLDPFLADQGYDTKFQTNFPGAAHQPHITINNASHFLQEDAPEQLTENILRWLEQTGFNRA